MTFEDFVTLIGQLGFPIFVATFFMVQLNKTLERLNTKLAELIIAVRELDK